VSLPPTLAHVSYPAHFVNDDIVIRKTVVGPFENNVYVVGCARSGEAVIVDAANEPERIFVATEGWGISRVVTTHGHGDHVQAVAAMKAKGIPVGIHPADATLARFEPDFLITDGDEITVGQVSLHAMHTPGHTPGGLCFLYEGETTSHLFSGDTLFPGGPGNTRNNATDFATIIESIRTRLLTLPTETVVYPGHGLDTTIGTEAPHLEEWIARGW
jgi:glyoxylase-like metal-dependent hydrolase (beta-lactamase superfamily II)